MIYFIFSLTIFVYIYIDFKSLIMNLIIFKCLIIIKMYIIY